MEVDLFIHGVPHGWDFWGLEKDRAYFGNFYKPNQAARQLVVETRPSEGKTYVYYHYLRHDNVVDFEARDGSYVGVTIRMDAYCLRWTYVWMLLERLFERHVCPVLFERHGTKLKWAVQALRLRGQELTSAQEQMLSLMRDMLSADDFAPIGTDFGPKTNTGVAICTVDASDQFVRQCIQQYGRVAVSHDHVAERERQAAATHRQQIDTLQASARQIQEQWQQQRYESEQALAALQQQVRTQQTEMHRLSQELRQSEQKLMLAENDAYAARQSAPRGAFGLRADTLRWLPYVTLALAVLTIVLLCLLTCSRPSAATTTTIPTAATTCPPADTTSQPIETIPDSSSLPQP